MKKIFLVEIVGSNFLRFCETEEQAQEYAEKVLREEQAYGYTPSFTITEIEAA